MFNNNMYGYANPYMMQPQRMDQMQYPQYTQPQTNIHQPQQLIGLQGKSVESIDVVRAMDIPLDGSISYFPLTDNSAIITKQLQQDGTSKILIYKPQEDKPKEVPKYVTEERLNELLNEDNKTNWEEEIKSLKRQIRDLQEDIKEMQKTKSRKGDD